MRCVLHIGIEKTATSLLQSWLGDNREQLSKHGCYLPRRLGEPNHRLFPAYFQKDLDDWARRNRLASLQEKRDFFADFEDNFKEELEVARENGETFLISSEHLHSKITSKKDLAEIRNFLAQHFDNIQILCYFRRQTELCLSR